MSTHCFKKSNKVGLTRWKDGEEIPFTEDCEIMCVTTISEGSPGYVILHVDTLWNVPDEWLEGRECFCSVDTIMTSGCRCGWIEKERNSQ